MIFESFYYMLTRYAFIFITFLFSNSKESVFWRDNKEQRFAHKWVYWTTSFSIVLLIDLVLHFVFYGARSILKLKKEYIYEILLQSVFWLCLIIYLSVDELEINAMIHLVNIMSLVFFFRLPVVVVLLMTSQTLFHPWNRPFQWRHKFFRLWRSPLDPRIPIGFTD